MNDTAIYLYCMGCLLALNYGHELDCRFTFGTLVLVVFWPVVVPVIWTFGIVKSVLDAVRS